MKFSILRAIFHSACTAYKTHPSICMEQWYCDGSYLKGAPFWMTLIQFQRISTIDWVFTGIQSMSVGASCCAATATRDPNSSCIIFSWTKNSFWIEVMSHNTDGVIVIFSLSLCGSHKLIEFSGNGNRRQPLISHSVAASTCQTVNVRWHLLIIGLMND